MKELQVRINLTSGRERPVLNQLVANINKKKSEALEQAQLAFNIAELSAHADWHESMSELSSLHESVRHSATAIKLRARCEVLKQKQTK